MTPAERSGPRPVRGLAATAGYAVPRGAAPIDLHLDANEGPAPDPALTAALADVELLRRYPRPHDLELVVADRFGVPPAGVIVTGGADDAILRAVLAYLDQGREIVLPTPAFEMIPRYAQLAGARIRAVPETEGRYPIEGVLGEIAAAGDRLGIVAVVSPSNPTGSVASPEDLVRVARAAPNALVLVDAAYAEYADRDLTETALALPNAIVLRTLSKAWGLAGARVGWALGPAALIAPLRAAGNPFATAGPSLALARAVLENSDERVRAHVATVRSERAQLADALAGLGAAPRPSQANFVLADVADPLWTRDALAGLGIGVRAFPGREGLERAVRITCPGNAADCGRVERALGAALAPEAVLFDMDGVLADVSRSYRRAILETAESFGISVTAADVARAKAAGHASCDWRLTRGLLAERGVDVPLKEVTERFEALYQGVGERDGLWRTETLLPERGLLERLAARTRLAVVTARPRPDAERFLATQGIEDLVRVLVTREDAPAKPDPGPLQFALERLGAGRAWMVGDTPDDVRAARATGVVPIGILAPGESEPKETRTALEAAGAARVIEDLAALEELLPPASGNATHREERP